MRERIPRDARKGCCPSELSDSAPGAPAGHCYPAGPLPPPLPLGFPSLLRLAFCHGRADFLGLSCHLGPGARSSTGHYTANRADTPNASLSPLAPRHQAPRLPTTPGPGAQALRGSERVLDGNGGDPPQRRAGQTLWVFQGFSRGTEVCRQSNYKWASFLHGLSKALIRRGKLKASRPKTAEGMHMGADPEHQAAWFWETTVP